MTSITPPYIHNKAKNEKTKSNHPVARNRGQFRKGRSGNPAGRPNGSRNRDTLAAEALLEGEADELMRLLIEKAKSGDATALRLCIDRIIPPRRSRPVIFYLPIIETVEDIVSAYQAVLRAAADGQLTPEEAQQFIRILEGMRDAMETVQLSESVADLIERVGLLE